MNSRHREERRNARKEVKKFELDKKTLEKSSKIRKKKTYRETTKESLFDTNLTRNDSENQKQ